MVIPRLGPSHCTGAAAGGRTVAAEGSGSALTCPPLEFVNAAAVPSTNMNLQARATQVRGQPISLGFSLGGWGKAGGRSGSSKKMWPMYA